MEGFGALVGGNFRSLKGASGVLGGHRRPGVESVLWGMGPSHRPREPNIV